MRAFVLGAGGNLGAMQVGALRSLLGRNIYPDLLVGCSVGGVNGAMLAQDLSPAGLEKLQQMWLTVKQSDIYPENLVGRIWRLASGQDSLFDNQNFYRFLVKNGLTPDYTFENVQQAKLLITAANLQSGKLHIFGEKRKDRVIDALMATTALPPLHAPWEVEGQQYIDGGAVTCLPIRVAIEQGATEIYALRVSQNEDNCQKSGRRGVINVVRNSINNMIRTHADYDLHLARHTSGIRMHYIQLTAPEVHNKNSVKVIPHLIERGFTLTESTFRREFSVAESRKSYATESWPAIRTEGVLQSI